MIGRRGRSIISLVTDRRRYGAGRMLPAIAAAAAAGVDLIQVRERDLSDSALLTLTREVVEAASPSAPVVVNERADVALAGGAAGVHLRGESVAASEVRRMAPPGFLIGRSVHSTREALDAVADGGCDYLIFGTVFSSASKGAGHPVAGLTALAEVCRAVAGAAGTEPPLVLAIGGVGARDALAITAAGAAGFAAISLFADASDMAALVAALRHAFDTSSGVV